ncbi:MAG: hypothetical protein WA133_12855 [Syntrophales bacterium]
MLLQHVFYATRGERSAGLLVFELLPREGHRPAEMMQRQEAHRGVDDRTRPGAANPW